MVKYICFTLLAVTLLIGCQTGKEMHYFREGDNYYRLRISEHSVSAKARYLAGFFDQHAVDMYFSDLSKTIDSPIVFISPNSPPSYGPSDGHRKLVIILSTNSDAIAEQIGAFASSEETLKLIADLANVDKINEIAEAQTEGVILDTLKAYVQRSATAYLNLPDTADSAAVKAAICNFLQDLKTYPGIDADRMNSLNQKYCKP